MRRVGPWDEGLAFLPFSFTELAFAKLALVTLVALFVLAGLAFVPFVLVRLLIVGTIPILQQRPISLLLPSE